MSFDALIGQEQAVKSFQNALSKGRLAHTYLIVGPEGVGKRTFAKEAAKVLLCKQAGLDACGSCSSCRKVESGAHPDFFWLEPVALTREADVEDDISGRNITMKQALDLYEDLQLKPLESRRKVAVVAECDMLNEFSANSFLKLFEEPPSNTIIFLTTARPAAVLPTVTSRCQIIRLAALSESSMIQILTGKFDLDEADAVKLAAEASGSVSRALWLAGEEGNVYRALAFEVLTGGPALDEERAACKIGNGCAAFALRSAPPRTKLFRELVRRNVKEVLAFMASFYNDVCRWQLYRKAEAHWGPDWTAAVREKAAELGPDDAGAIVRLALEAAEYIDLNVDVELVVGDFLRRSARKQSRLHV